MRLLRAMALAGATISLATASTALAAAPGVSPDLTWGISHTQMDQQTASMQQQGVKWVRLNVEWNAVEGTKGTYDSYMMGEYDHAVADAHNAGMKIVMLISNSPQWASGSTNKSMPPQNPQDYANFVKYLAGHWKGQVDAYEIWNEENISRFWPTAAGPSAADYVKLLQPAYTAIKSADPNAQVVFGGTSNNDYTFIQNAYAAGAKGYFDVMSVHPYTCVAPDNVAYSGGKISSKSFLGYREVHNTMVANGDDKPIMFTEFGWSTTTQSCGVTEQQQADYLTKSFQLMAQDPYVLAAIWYTYRNLYWDNNADTIEDQFGLVKVDGTPKPSLAAFESASANSSSTGGTTSGGTTSGGTTSGGTTTGGTTSGGTTSGGTTSGGTTSGGTTTTPPPDTAPTVSLTSPVANTQFVSSLALAANASDDKGVTKVEFYLDGKLVATDTTAPYSLNYNVSKHTSYGNHTVYAKAYDAAGHVTTSASVTVTRVKTLTATIAVVRTPKLSKAGMSKKRPGKRLERKSRRHVRR